MSDQLSVQIEKMEKQYRDLKTYFESDGQVTADEQQVLQRAQTTLTSLRQKAKQRAEAAKNGSPAKPQVAGEGQAGSPSKPVANPLSESAWKAVLQKHQGKLKDNGLQRTLAIYEKLKLKEGNYDERLKALQLVFKLALDLNAGGAANAFPDAKEYLGKVCELAVQAQEVLQKQKNDIAKKQKDDAVDPRDKELEANKISDAAKDITHSAKENTALFGMAVANACDAFEKHAKAELSELEDQMTPEELISSLVGMAIPVIGGKLAEAVVHEIGKKIVKKMTSAVNDRLSSVIKSAGKDMSKKALEKAVNALVTAGKNAPGAVQDVVTRTIMPLCDRVITTVKAGKKLDPQMNAFIAPFIRLEGGKVDSLLEARFGVPAPAKSKETQVKLFRDMVRVFEEKLIIAKASSNEKMDWNATGGGLPHRLRQAADLKAQQASKQLEKQMTQEGAGRR